MKTSTTILAAALTLAACAAPPPKPVVRENLVTKTATVESVDAASRLVTIRTEDGYATTVKVSDAVKNLPQVKAGDKVRFDAEKANGAYVVTRIEPKK